MQQNIYYALLHSVGLTQKNLMDIFESGEVDPKIFYETLSAESLIPYISDAKKIAHILAQRQSLKPDEVIAPLKKLDVSLITILDNGYPESLKHISHSPFLLYVRGTISDQKMFGVVGSRKITSYGKKVISQLVPEIARVFPIVSGGAAGCDSAAHEAAMQVGQPTVSIIGTGIDQNYPVGNADLFNRIVETGGAVVSIFPVGEPGNPYNFPVRNEIVVGLSQGILVIEAAEKSGSLITASLALDYGKDVFALPGDITHANSAGCNGLIRTGAAKCVTRPEHILEEYDIAVKRATHTKNAPKLDPLETAIFDLLSQEELDVESLSQKLQIAPALLLTKLSLLELKQIVCKNISGNYMLK